MKITNRIPFTLADYESGKYRVVTRNNCDARIICKDRMNKYPIIALIKNTDSDEFPSSYLLNGKYREDRDDDADLLLEEIAFEDGDIVTSDANCRIGIIGLNNCYYAILYSSGTLRYGSHCYLFKPRLATEEEKQRLFNALAKDGMRWNSEKKLIEYIEEECELKPFDKVLVRNNNAFWSADIFGEYIPNKGYMCTSKFIWEDCIPYKGNEKLLGTDNNPLL